MLSIRNSVFKTEIVNYLARGGLVTILPPQEEPVRPSAKPRNSDDEDNEENILNELVSYVDGGVFYRREGRK